MNDHQINVAERIKALESALVNLRERLDDMTTDLGLTPGNTRLVIQRVSVMKAVREGRWVQLPALRGKRLAVP
jgi:hypothetical protein